ncbi:histidine kinase N-terminal 7TM domain-containing protein [Methanospirillum stamsii]|uniref:histidine kinase n=1 Tax=Methanospirillum stamsii TaxID=1277351 RepID=A0A2V2N6P3_9EURY|nr:histidine kinase N-terminal 7TM domain-containing protein [Methanospirillum stamsii]PWR75509.1 hypothetical protein DLD82_05110 [Methanospirillum stamsii]
MQFSLYASLLFLSSLISIALAGYALTRIHEKVMRSFVYLMAGVFCWSFSYFLESVSTSVISKLFWSVISVIDLVVPVFFLFFVLQFTRSSDRIPPVMFYSLIIIPCISFFISATFPFHGLVWPEIYLIHSFFAGFSLYYMHGAWYWVEIIYSIMLYSAAVWLLLQSAIRSPPAYAVQMWLVFVSSLFPFVSSLLYAFAAPVFRGIDITPFSFILTGIVLFYAITRYSLFDLIPIAYKQIIQDMQEGVIVLDKDSRIVEMNPAAVQYLPVTQDIIGEHYSALFPYLPGNFNDGSGVSVSRSGISKVSSRWLEFREYPINLDKNPLKADGILILCIDVTEREIAKQEISARNEQLQHEVSERCAAEESLRQANKKLGLLSGITRHDILNSVTVVNGYARMLQESGNERDPEAPLRIVEAGEKIVEIISFTGVYENMGTTAPRWIRVASIFNEPDILPLTQKMFFSLDISGLFVYADLMFSRVFYNLLDNTLRHSKGASKVRVFGEVRGHEYCLVYEDNGTGIPPEEKEIIFRQGHGKNTGLGLFLIREILDITGIRIQECGVYGEGARFEMIIPEGGFRFERDE